MINDNKILNVPHLRFKEFNNSFHKLKCSDFLEFYSTNSLSWDQLSYNNKSSIKNLHYGLIHNGAPTLIDSNEYQLPYAQISIRNYTLCKNGDVIFADASEDTKDVCKSVEFINTNNQNIVSGLHTIHARDIRNITVLGFKGYLFSSYQFHKQIKRLTQGTKIYSINQSNFSELYVGIPNKCEQSKIVDFLQKIDKRILTQNKIISQYETLIKGIRYRIFTSIESGEQLPLGSFLEEYSEKNIANNLQSVAVGKYGIRKREDIYSKELSADYSKNKVIRKDTLIIGMGSTQIDIGILTTDDCYCVSPAYSTYHIKGINSFYLQEYLIALNPLLSVRYMITSARQGKAVNKEDLMQHELTIHSLCKQKEICQCFGMLYDRLQAEKRMLSALQKQKAFLLQTMFI